MIAKKAKSKNNSTSKLRPVADGDRIRKVPSHITSPKGIICSPGDPRGSDWFLKTGYSCLAKQTSITQGLLQLPAELRARIWIETLGGRHIHVWRGAPKRCPLRGPLGYKLDHDICTAPEKLRTDGCHNVTSKELSAIRSKPPNISNFDHNHSYCQKRKWKLNADDPRLNLNVLRTNRQVYNEAIEALMSTNTFCFDDSVVLAQFLKSYGFKMCRMLRFLYLAFAPFMELALAFQTLSKTEIPEEEAATTTDVSSLEPLLRTHLCSGVPRLYLEGLREVYISIPLWKMNDTFYDEELEYSFRDRKELDSFMGLIDLPLVHVTLVVTEEPDPTTDLAGPHPSTFKMFSESRRRIVDMIEPSQNVDFIFQKTA